MRAECSNGHRQCSNHRCYSNEFFGHIVFVDLITKKRCLFLSRFTAGKNTTLYIVHVGNFFAASKRETFFSDYRLFLVIRNWLAWSHLRQKSDHFLPDSAPPNQLQTFNTTTRPPKVTKRHYNISLITTGQKFPTCFYPWDDKRFNHFFAYNNHTKQPIQPISTTCKNRSRSKARVGDSVLLNTSVSCKYRRIPTITKKAV